MEVREKQRAKAPSPINVTLFGMVIEVRLEQLWNAVSPMEVTLLGMVTEVRLVQDAYLQLIVYQIVVI